MHLNKRKLEISMANNCMTAEMLSAKAGVSAITITRIKNGLQRATPATIGKIAKALGVRVEELIEHDAATSDQNKPGVQG